MYDLHAATTLRPDQLINARLVAHRIHILPHLKQGGTFVEVGVAFGDFSEQILNIVKPKRFVGIDLFDLHHHDMLWGKPTKEVFGEATHADYYEQRIRNVAPGTEISVITGDSVAAISAIPDHSVDVFYIDADHSYEGVKRDANAIVDKIKPDGVVIFNDFIMYDHLAGAPLGIVQAATEFIAENDYEVIFFALNDQMFCDIAVRKRI